jgi:hypothetical protein
MSDIPKDIPVYPSRESDTKLVNLEHVDDGVIDEYIGAENELYNFDESDYNNPFRSSKFGQDGAVENYKAYFYYRIISEPGFLDKVLKLEDKTLGSWSYPAHDHGEVIVDFVKQNKNKKEGEVYQYVKEQLKSVKRDKLGIKGLEYLEKCEKELENLGFVME